MDEISELALLVANQRQELMAASATESDLDLAFRLQMEEALAASASLLPSSSSPSPVVAVPSSSTADSIDSDLSHAHALDLQSLELYHYQQERCDAELRRTEMRRAAEALRLRAHDERFAREIQAMSDEDWDNYGDNFERPIELLHADEELPFRLYFKGMSQADVVHGGASVQVAGIGVAICDPRGELLLKIQKPVPATGTNREVLDAKALIEGLNAVVELGIKNVKIYFEYRTLLNHVIGKWRAKQQKVVNLINQVRLLQRKLDRCQAFLLPRWHVKFVFKLVREVIDSQITKGDDLIPVKANNNPIETCNICLEITVCSQIFSIDGCGHRFCFSCMRQHVEVKLLHGMLPNCPHYGCNIRLEAESSRKFLPPRLLQMMCQRIKEESIPPNEKVYCPYPRCSALMSTSETISPEKHCSAKLNIADNSALRKCIKCSGFFCINCKVPWHERMSCYEYKRSNPHLHAEDVRLHSLARQKFWRQCVKCSHMIELSEGCFHMTCRCGYEFCYTCGAEWKDKKATCSCPLWDEQYIWYEDTEEESEDDYYDEDDDIYFDDNDDDEDDDDDDDDDNVAY